MKEKKMYIEPAKERFLSHLELRKLEGALTQQEKAQPSSSCSVNAICLLLYTGCRPSEVLTLRWEDVHLEDGYLFLKDSKVGARIVPLNDKAHQILTSLQKQEDNPYVFCGKLPGMHLKDIDTTWHKVCTLAGIPDVRLQDLRHSFASFALKEGVDLYTVSKLLGHKNIAMTTRFAHLKLEHLKEATNKIAGVFG